MRQELGTPTLMTRDSGSARNDKGGLFARRQGFSFSLCHFPCVILERSEESRILSFGLFFVSFRAAAAKNPGVFLSTAQHSLTQSEEPRILATGREGGTQTDTEKRTGILRSADSALE